MTRICWYRFAPRRLRSLLVGTHTVTVIGIMILSTIHYESFARHLCFSKSLSFSGVLKSFKACWLLFESKSGWGRGQFAGRRLTWTHTHPKPNLTGYHSSHTVRKQFLCSSHANDTIVNTRIYEFISILLAVALPEPLFSPFPSDFKLYGVSTQIWTRPSKSSLFRAHLCELSSL